MTRFGACAKLVRRRQTAAQALNARPRPPNSSGDLWDAAEARMTRFSACAKLARRRHAWPKAHSPRSPPLTPRFLRSLSLLEAGLHSVQRRLCPLGAQWVVSGRCDPHPRWFYGRQRCPTARRCLHDLAHGGWARIGGVRGRGGG